MKKQFLEIVQAIKCKLGYHLRDSRDNFKKCRACGEVFGMPVWENPPAPPPPPIHKTKKCIAICYSKPHNLLTESDRNTLYDILQKLMLENIEMEITYS